jgi:hypothetical protein
MSAVRMDLNFGWGVEQEGESTGKEADSVAMRIINYC